MTLELNPEYRPDTISREDVKHLFDLAVEGMDFGSGFLNHEDVVMLRRIAELLGVTADKATPSNFRASFAHEWQPGREQVEYKPIPGTWRTDPNKVISRFLICDYCRRREENPVHHGVSVTEPTQEYE